jgi:voltage-gated potassium channel
MNKNHGWTPTGKIKLAIFALLFLVAFGTSGFILVERMGPLESLYMTVITMSTVGFGEVSPLHPGGRVFVIFLIVASVVTVTFAGSAIGQFILEGQLRNILGRRKMDTKIKNLSDHYVIAGFGRVGRKVAEEYTRRKVPFVVIENNPTVVSELEKESLLYINGPATEDESLLAAGIDRARVLISTLPNEADNVYLSLTARQMNPNLYIIARADQPEGEKKLKRAGANSVVSPHLLGGIRMAMAALRPNVVDFMQMTALEGSGLGIEEVQVPPGCRFGGKTLADSGMKAEYGVTVIGIKKGNQQLQINPPPSAVIEPGDILVLIGASDKLEQLTGQMDR